MIPIWDEIIKKRRQNEKKFRKWQDLPKGGRKYWFEVKGKFGYWAKYVKEVDEREETTKFYQEIFDEKDNLIEIHEKFPIDKGHKKIGG